MDFNGFKIALDFFNFDEFEYELIFSEIDTNGDGFIDIKE